MANRFHSEGLPRRSLLKLIALAAGALACNLPTLRATPGVTPPGAPTLTGDTATAPPTPSPIPPTITSQPAPSPTPAPPALFVVDAHCDIAWNWLEFGRDPRRSALESRQVEGPQVESFVGQRVTGLLEWQQGRVGILFATLYVMPAHRAWSSSMSQVYGSASQAHALAMAQLDAYHRLAAEDARFRLIASRQELDEVAAAWSTPAETPPPIGLVISMEGADPIEEPSQVGAWHAQGLRAIGPAWAATRYAGGTGEPGPLTDLGRQLLDEMAPLNMILDLSHIAEQAYFEALDRYPGPIIASHSNPRAFLPTDRGLSDEMIRALAHQDGVIGIALYNRYLKPGWQEGDPRSEVTLDTVAQAIDYTAQVSGAVEHVAIGSDFDGGFGLAAIPQGMDSAADLLRIADALGAWGYSDEQIAAVMNGNWLRVLRRSLG